MYFTSRGFLCFKCFKVFCLRTFMHCLCYVYVLRVVFLCTGTLTLYVNTPLHVVKFSTDFIRRKPGCMQWKNITLIKVEELRHLLQPQNGKQRRPVLRRRCRRHLYFGLWCCVTGRSWNDVELDAGWFHVWLSKRLLCRAHRCLGGGRYAYYAGDCSR